MNLVAPLSRVDRSAVSVKAAGGSTAGTRITIIDDHAIAHVLASKGQADTVASQLGISAKAGQASVTTDFTALPLAPGQWMLYGGHGSEGKNGGFCRQLKDKLGAAGNVSEQSHARIIFRLSGENARQVMQKGCRLDLHPAVSGSGFCAQTNMAQTGVIMHQLDDVPSYDLLVYSGFAQSFFDWLVHSSAEFGVDVV